VAFQGLAAADAVIVAFDDHPRRARGIGSSARQSCSRFAREFLEVVLGDGPVDLTRPGVPDVVGYVTEATARYRPSAVQLLTTALRSFLRFVRSEGLREDRLEEAVPMVSRRRLASLPRHPGAAGFARLIASLDSSSPQGLRDRAILLFAARLGLRASEVACLGPGDLDWRSGTVRVRTRKTGHGALLPLPHEVGEALAAYLERGRPASEDRHLFLLHRQHAGAPIDRHVASDAVRRALRRAGIDAPAHGTNLLRHSLATDLLAHGASLRQIAGLFGHRALSSTQIYAKVDVAALREAALPWPKVTW
jgi:site-specific recombinase XerD